MREDSKILANRLFTVLSANWHKINTDTGTVNAAELMTLLLTTIDEKPKAIPFEEKKQQRANGRLSLDEKVEMAARFLKELIKKTGGGFPGKDQRLAEMQTLEAVKQQLKAKERKRPAELN